MKTIIYELYSGVGLCNQLFSLETAIYLACISKRKLILLIKNPLCHIGKATWEYGYLLNFFTNDFLRYLPYGFDVFYGDTPCNITDILNDVTITKELSYPKRFSELVFIDPHLDNESNKDDIDLFCNSRIRACLNIDINDNYENLYIYQCNASRCFYNFYTTKDNYTLMYNICTSLKFKDVFHDIANNIYNSINNDKNNFKLFMHMRFGDKHKDLGFISRFNNTIIRNIIPYVDAHKTNLITPDIYMLCDNNNNKAFFGNMSKYNIQHVDQITVKYINNFFQNNKHVFFDYHDVNDKSVCSAIVDMLLAVKANAFIGTLTSTFSHYIQFLRYLNGKSYQDYCNITDGEFCKFKCVNDSKYDWIKYNYKGGHPIAWHAFWNINMNHSRTLMTIKGKTDGFGSQLQAIFSLIAYCNYKGYTYVHTPMYAMHHNDDNIENFPDYMNNFINIESHFPSIKDLTNYEKSIVHNVKEGEFVHGSFHPEYFYNDSILKLLQNIYFSKSKPDLTYDSNYINLAIHIRRGDVSNTKHLSRFTTNKDYINILQKINLDNTAIHIFSEGDDSDFQDIVASFPNNKIVMHMNDNIQLSFHYLVMADILVIAKSSFSYCAALINSGKIIANNIRGWWHKPLKRWLIV
tara:strand:+ start:617 stop:2518 length:1902 start_codon:yes stop_codon:yes gene_type:complete